jgi:ribosome-binding protein aMBF1 (putative translation factor)
MQPQQQFVVCEVCQRMVQPQDIIEVTIQEAPCVVCQECAASLGPMVRKNYR